MNMRLSVSLVFFSIAVTQIAHRSLFAEEPVRVGIIAGTTGAFADIGKGAVQSIEMACDSWNGEVKTKVHQGPLVECFFEDDGFDTKKGLTAFQRLHSVKKIDALINVNSTTIPALAPKIRKESLPTIQVFLEGGTPAIDSIFQICPDVEPAEKELGKVAAERYPGKLAMVTSSNDVINRLAEAFIEGAGKDIARVDIPIESTDVRSSVLQLVKFKPEAILFITTPSHGALVEKELQVLRVKAARIFDANFISAIDEYEKLVGNLDYLSSSLLLNISFPESEQRRLYRRAYQEKYKTTPAPWAEYSYDAFPVLMKAYSAERSQWIQNLQETSLEGVSGKIEFSEIGATKPEFEIITVGDFLKRRAVGDGE